MTWAMSQWSAYPDGQVSWAWPIDGPPMQLTALIGMTAKANIAAAPARPGAIR